uniref:Protein kinase domain-containing protein n=1 Tax=Oreochromis niloticus TaxID=8128 RepID=A0A669C4W7_ORENI
MVVNRHESPIKVKLIDFGLACKTSAVITGDVIPFQHCLSRSAPCTDMNSTGEKTLCLSAAFKLEESRIAKIQLQFPNLSEYPQKGHVNTSANPSSSEDDLEISEGTILGDHHMVESFLGEGGFGVVTRCRNTKNNQIVAIKVNKSDPEILQQAKQEIFILEQLQRLDPDRCNIVEWNGYFLDGERICLNFELLDQSLWDYIGGWNNQGLPIRELRPILHQIANALFHLGSVGIVHADLKPANIMVVNRHESPIKVKLIDFGLACKTSAVITGDRVGRLVIVHPRLSVELATGVPLYPGKTIMIIPFSTLGEKTLWSLSSLQAGRVKDRKNSTAVSKTQLNILKKDMSTLSQPIFL